MRSIALFILIAVMTSCGVPEAPLAQVATPSPVPVASATVVPATVAQATVAPQPSVAPQLSSTMLPLVRNAANDPSLSIDPSQPGEVLLRDVWPIVTNAIPTRYLYYMQSRETSTGSLENTFWRADLQNMQQTLLESQVSGSTLGQGQLSPDGTWIAYQVDTGENSADLFVMRSDGSVPTFIAANVGAVAEGCDSYLAWSPDSQRIAFNRYNSTGTAPEWNLEVVALDNPTIAQRILSAPFLKFLGWTDVEHLLTLSGDYGQMPLIQEIGIQNGTHRLLQEFPRMTGTNCTKLSPDKTNALLSLSTGDWLLDIATGQMQPIAVRNGSRTTWSPRDLALIELPSTSPAQPIVVLRNTPLITQTVRMLPQGALGSVDVDHWGISSAAPDGRFTATCQLAALADGSYLRRLVLYDVVQHTWTIISNDCGFVLGWRSTIE